MLQNLKKILFLSLILSVNISGQVIYEPGSLFHSIFENRDRVNPYYVGKNPAFLFYDGRDQLLSIQSSFNNSEGNFKRFVDPETSRLYQLGFSGKKVLDSTQVFRGVFAVQREERDNWNWFSTKNYNTGNPFLLGDSTGGRYRYNGILMKAEYSSLLMHKLLTGFSLIYGVDEGLKEVSPRPTSEHRDIDLKVGLGYLFDKNFSVGVSLGVFDYNEKISYREDKEALLQETILFKFRGYDNPFVLTKKTETRYSFHNGYFGGINLFYTSENFFTVSAFIGSEIEHLSIEDDANNPQPEGYWKNNTYKAGLRASIDFSSKLKGGVYYRYDYREMWAKHPTFDVLLMENENPAHLIEAGIEYEFSESLTLGFETGAGLVDIDFNDYYSDVFWDVEAHTMMFKLGADYQWNDNFNTFFGYGFTKYNTGNSDLSSNGASGYFNNFRIADVLYYQSSFVNHSVFSKLSFYPGFLGIMNFYFIYDSYLPQNTILFNDTKRNSLNAVFELKIKAY